MKTQTGEIRRQQKAGGWAALYLALAYLVAMPYFLLFSQYQSATGTLQKVTVLAAEHDGMRVMYLVTYVVFGIVLAVLALALYRRLRDAGPVLAQVATAVGLIWAVVLVASGLVFNAGMAAAVGLHGTDPVQAAALWQAVEPVAQGLGGSGGELLGGVWVLLVSVAVLRARALPRPLGWFGLVVGGAGLLSVVPAFGDLAVAFGLLQIAWFAWLGIVMLRPARRSAAAAVQAPDPRPARLAAQRQAS